jgi:hypothetical protein
MQGKSELKFLVAFGLSVVLGYLMGSLVLGLVVGTCLGLVWGYTDTLLGSSRRHSVRKAPRAKTKKRKTSRRRRK